VVFTKSEFCQAAGGTVGFVDKAIVSFQLSDNAFIPG
jgi:hypothetical protein